MIKKKEIGPLISKRRDLFYFASGLSMGFIICIIVLILATIPVIKSIDSSNLGLYDKDALIKKNMSNIKLLNQINDIHNCSGTLFNNYDGTEWSCYSYKETKDGTLQKRIIIN